MQTDYLWHGIKGFKKLERLCYLWDMKTKEAQERLKILRFYEKYGLSATVEAFEISRRTLFRWKALLKSKQGDSASLNPKSCKPKRNRQPSTPKIIIDEIKRLRTKYPNLGKTKLHTILHFYCKENNLHLPSESTIGRIIAKDKEKMRMFPYRIDSQGKSKPIRKKSSKPRLPKGVNQPPMGVWAVDTIQRVSVGIKRYIMTMIDPHTRIAFAVAIPSKHTKHTSKVLEALIDGVSESATQKDKRIAILSDNGSEFKKDFDELLQQKELTHYWTYPRSPKMNAHNERFNRTIQEQFVDYYDDLLFTDIEEFNKEMASWLIDYNTKIPHHSLGLKAPVEYTIQNYPECQRLWTNTRRGDLEKHR